MNSTIYTGSPPELQLALTVLAPRRDRRALLPDVPSADIDPDELPDELPTAPAVKTLA